MEQEKQRLEELSEKEVQAKEKLRQLEKKADDAKVRVDQLVPKMKALEAQARKHTGDAEDILPQPDLLETAKAYREHKAKLRLSLLPSIFGNRRMRIMAFLLSTSGNT